MNPIKLYSVVVNAVFVFFVLLFVALLGAFFIGCDDMPYGSIAPLQQSAPPVIIEKNNTKIVEVPAERIFIDPCGDEPGEVDEVLEYLENPVFALNEDEQYFYLSSYLAWFKNVGLVFLECGKSYRTTDKQKCDFYISSEEDGCEYGEVGE